MAWCLIKHRDNLHSVKPENMTPNGLRYLEEYELLTASYIRHNAVMAALQGLNTFFHFLKINHMTPKTSPSQFVAFIALHL
jgi:hypothetical protein